MIGAPLVSVVVPARNEERLLPAALRSIAAQALPGDRLEAVVVSNGSVDRTVELARLESAVLAANGGPAVQVLSASPPGVARAKNVGAWAARGRLLIFMDADSRMSPGLVAAVIDRAAAGELAASIRVVADSRDPLDRAFFWTLEYGKRLVGTRANMFWCERVLFESLGGFDERLNHAEDLDFLVRAARAGIQVGHIHHHSIATSTRRLHRLPLRLGMVTMLGRWVLGHVGIGRGRPYSGGGP